MKKGERILYPCYFDATLERSGGRRVPRSLGVKSPTLQDLERALRKEGIKFRVEEKSHPGHWFKREGRALVTWGEGKEKLLKRVAGSLEAKR